MNDIIELITSAEFVELVRERSKLFNFEELNKLVEILLIDGMMLMTQWMPLKHQWVDVCKITADEFLSIYQGII